MDKGILKPLNYYSIIEGLFFCVFTGMDVITSKVQEEIILQFHYAYT